MKNSLTIEQVVVLEGIFAKMTSDGWQIPMWLRELQIDVGLDPMPGFYVCEFPTSN